MNAKRTLGIVLIVIGAVMLFFSDYIAQRVAEGKLQIKSAQGQVDRAESLFSVSKYTKPIGKTITGSAQKKIDAGQMEVDKYESLSNNLKIGGVVLIVIGAILVLFSRKRRR